MCIRDSSSYDEYMQRVSKVIHRCCGEEGLPIPWVVIEPGRSIVGPAGTTLYTVGSVKEIKNIRTYVAIDGGMTDNPRYALYQAAYDLLVANRAAEPKTQTVTVAGKCCESGDLIQENARIQEVGPGDILAVLATGADVYKRQSGSDGSALQMPFCRQSGEKGENQPLGRLQLAELM